MVVKIIEENPERECREHQHRDIPAIPREGELLRSRVFDDEIAGRVRCVMWYYSISNPGDAVVTVYIDTTWDFRGSK